MNSQFETSRFRLICFCGLVCALLLSCDGENDAPPAKGQGGSPGMMGELVGGAGGERSATEPVSFSHIQLEDVTATRVVVTFDTSVETSCEALYGTSEAALYQIAVDPDMAEGELSIDHTVPLEDLTPATTYFWRARATNAAGETYLSDIHDFTTPEGEAGPAGTNFALPSEGASVTAVSSNFGGGDDDSTWGANQAFDGEMATEWATSGDGDDAWVELSFGQMRTLDACVFRSRKMSDGSSIIESVRLVSGEGERILGPFSAADPDRSYTFGIDPPLTTESIRIEAVETTGGNTGVKEIQFFGPE